MDENFYVRLYRKSVANDHRCIHITLPAQPYALLDALERLGADEGEQIGVDVANCATFRYLPALLELDCHLIELNALAEKFVTFDDNERACFAGLPRFRS